ncbi:hypothetical protein ACFQX7_26960 [Luedemannella flava]
MVIFFGWRRRDELAVAGFSYKTSWLAVPGRSVEDVADALNLDHREVLDWATGTERAYKYGVYVASPVPGLDAGPRSDAHSGGLRRNRPGFS